HAVHLHPRRRGDAYRGRTAAGAADDLRAPDGFATFALSQSDVFRLGYRVAASSGTSFAAMYKAVRQSMECLAENRLAPFLGPGGAEMEMKRSHQTSRLDRLLEVERRTV